MGIIKERIEEIEKELGMEIPVIENIHQKVLQAVTKKGNRLNMDSWHECDSMHCRAGWVVHLAGKKGYKLEENILTSEAAMFIYRKSSDIGVPLERFWDDDFERAMKDIIRCAEEERKQNEHKGTKK